MSPLGPPIPPFDGLHGWGLSCRFSAQADSKRPQDHAIACFWTMHMWRLGWEVRQARGMVAQPRVNL